MESRIEILKSGVWVKLRLQNSNSVKYNARINEIGSTSNRQIGRTNTFTLPNTHDNSRALGINIFNPLAMANALNIKYEARYFIEEKLVQSGFLIVNNTNGGSIQVNFIDKSLDIVTKWGSVTYKQLLRDEVLEIDGDYGTAIEELRAYDMNPAQVLTPLPPIGIRGYHLCLFPNNLNTLGDEFQQNFEDIRVDNGFNPYQSRPIFNVKSLFDLATSRFGYTAIYDSSVNWDDVEHTYMVGEGMDENEDGSSGFVTKQYPTISYNVKHYIQVVVPSGYDQDIIMLYPSSNSLKPTEIAFWKDSDKLRNNGGIKPWLDQNCVFIPNLEVGNAGSINFRAQLDLQGTVNYYVVLYWKSISGLTDLVSTEYVLTDNGTGTPLFPSEIVAEVGGFYSIDVTVDKTLFNDIPVGASEILGVQIICITTHNYPTSNSLSSMSVREDFLEGDAVVFDEFGQYQNAVVDLSFGAPKETVKTLLISAMQKEGILMDIDADEKTIKFFSYGAYEVAKEAGEFSDWSKYLLSYTKYKWETNYGNTYGKINQIGLKDPFQGNTFKYDLQNQGSESRYKDLAQDYNKNFKDVEQVLNVDNSLIPYTEYTNTGLGLVEYRGNVGTPNVWIQTRYDGDIQGNFSALPEIANVNYGELPQGVTEWYRLIDEAIRVKPAFLLPIDILKNIDLSTPIYVNDLGGYYIIEKVAEYVDEVTPVKIHLIKLIDNLSADDSIPTIDSIRLLSIVNKIPGLDVFVLDHNITFLNYIPAGASIKCVQLTAHPDSGGVPTGYELNEVLSLPPYAGNSVQFTSDNPIGAQEGWYECVVTDVELLQSNTTLVYFGEETVPIPPSVTILVNDFGSGPDHGNVAYDFVNFTAEPTFSTFWFREYDVPGGTPIGGQQALAFPTSPDSGFVEVDFGSPGLFLCQLKTDIADSPENYYVTIT